MVFTAEGSRSYPSPFSSYVTVEAPEPEAALGLRELTRQSSQHSPCAHTASGFRVQVVALQQLFVHSWGREWDSFDRVTWGNYSWKAPAVKGRS